MLIIAQEPSQATEKLRRLLDSFGIQSRVFYTNFETDVDKDTISLASSFIYSSEEDYQGTPLFFLRFVGSTILGIVDFGDYDLHF